MSVVRKAYTADTPSTAMQVSLVTTAQNWNRPEKSTPFMFNRAKTQMNRIETRTSAR